MDERARRALPWRGEWPVIGAVAAGGALGATARYGAGLLWSTPAGTFPWTTLLVNVAGCAAMGVLMVLITEAWTAHRLLRPFLGTGILGGFTTFSTYAVDIARLVDADRLPLAAAYLAGTLLAALAAVALAASATRALLGLRRRTA
ncbi:CrcB family protein [Streptomyces sp. RS10V-4]|uniref:fluoride efflux transporter FluC n=1 Tax=Streptomyces rhizoryzae TaxID=2932493 RepID=UPI002002CF81|nr:CrcB family protein [Streptomyces rhizoryzae]MCK7624007.1 CrcB family protein [Streptomyces rhizoryzae]